MPKKFKGKLSKRIEPRVANYLLPANRLDPILEKHREEDAEKIALLCVEYDIPPDNFMFFRLSLALAREFIPGFQEKKKRGTKVKWNTSRHGVLVVEIEKIRDEQNYSVTEAARKLALRQPWRDFLDARERGDPLKDAGEALRRQYNNACRNSSADYHRNHYVKLREASTDDEWAEYLRKLFD